MRPDIFFSDNPFHRFAEVKSSRHHNLGVFAKVHIPQGTAWWQARRQDALIIERNQYEILDASPQPSLSSMLREAILHYGYYLADSDYIILILDGGRFVNHSFEPNSVASQSKVQSIALHDIEPGEEILENYAHFGKCPWAPMYGHFGKTLWG